MHRMRAIAAVSLVLAVWTMNINAFLSRVGRLNVAAVSRYRVGAMGFETSSMRSWMSSGADGEDTVVSRCTQKIQDALSPSKLVVQAAHDDPNGSHISVEVVSTMFEGKRSVQRQRLVYKAIWDEMKDGGAVHAVDQIIAQTPDEAA